MRNSCAVLALATLCVVNGAGNQAGASTFVASPDGASYFPAVESGGALTDVVSIRVVPSLDMSSVIPVAFRGNGESGMRIATLVAARSARKECGTGMGLAPGDLSQSEHAGLRDFVAWMRAEKYPENIISKWVQDYMDPKFTTLMMSEIGKKAKFLSPLVPDKGFLPPVKIKYIDIVPLDEGSEKIEYDEDIIRARFKNTFGMDVEVERVTHMVNFKETFGEFTIKTMGMGSVAKLNDPAYHAWAKSFLVPLYVLEEYPNPSNK